MAVLTAQRKRIRKAHQDMARLRQRIAHIMAVQHVERESGEQEQRERLEQRQPGGGGGARDADDDDAAEGKLSTEMRDQKLDESPGQPPPHMPHNPLGSQSGDGDGTRRSRSVSRRNSMRQQHALDMKRKDLQRLRAVREKLEAIEAEACLLGLTSTLCAHPRIVHIHALSTSSPGSQWRWIHDAAFTSALGFHPCIRTHCSHPRWVHIPPFLFSPARVCCRMTARRGPEGATEIVRGRHGAGRSDRSKFCHVCGLPPHRRPPPEPSRAREAVPSAPWDPTKRPNFLVPASGRSS